MDRDTRLLYIGNESEHITNWTTEGIKGETMHATDAAEAAVAG